MKKTLAILLAFMTITQISARRKSKGISSGRRASSSSTVTAGAASGRAGGLALSLTLHAAAAKKVTITPISKKASTCERFNFIHTVGLSPTKGSGLRSVEYTTGADPLWNVEFSPRFSDDASIDEAVALKIIGLQYVDRPGIRLVGDLKDYCKEPVGDGVRIIFSKDHATRRLTIEKVAQREGVYK